MKIYQVGGAVRDKLLKRQTNDFDYVVIGSTMAQMRDKGFQQVGRNFPVFLHPETKDEYALARKEIKTGPKHTDFSFVFDETITLEEDVQRRDFTCNALAFDEESGQIIDYVGGQKDIAAKVLRHVNAEHFIEDPLRVLRMCRFAAQLDFTVAPETMKLCQEMTAAGMLNYLTGERVWREIEKTLPFPNFDRFITTARECGALKVILPEIDALWNVPEKKEYHPEGNSGEHTLLVLRRAAAESPRIKFAALLHDVGKTVTTTDILPAHYQHESNGLPLIEKICQRLKTPLAYSTLAKLVCKNHMTLPQAQQMRTAKLLDLIVEVTANFRSEQNLTDLIAVCRCDMLGRAREIPQTEQDNFARGVARCRQIYEKSSTIKATDMPNYRELPKDEHFKKLYRDFILRELQKIGM